MIQNDGDEEEDDDQDDDNEDDDAGAERILGLLRGTLPGSTYAASH